MCSIEWRKLIADFAAISINKKVSQRFFTLAKNRSPIFWPHKTEFSKLLNINPITFHAISRTHFPQFKFSSISYAPWQFIFSIVMSIVSLFHFNTFGIWATNSNYAFVTLVRKKTNFPINDENTFHCRQNNCVTKIMKIFQSEQTFEWLFTSQTENVFFTTQQWVYPIHTADTRAT